jgi:Mg/Co/Ni transporter MgtE
MSDRLKSFSLDELSALVFPLDIAETVEQLDEVTARLREEFIRELQERE